MLPVDRLFREDIASASTEIALLYIGLELVAKEDWFAGVLVFQEIPEQWCLLSILTLRNGLLLGPHRVLGEKMGEICDN